jgi:hypothetical protein
MWTKRENLLTKLLCGKAVSLLCSVLIVASLFAFLSLLPNVRATTVVISMTPTQGTVGTTVNLIGNITTVNGNYSILWDGSVLVSNVAAVENRANVSFVVPTSKLGNHTVLLLDVAKKENATQTFNVLTGYSLSVSPKPVAPAQSQEGDNFTFSLGITGGNNTALNVANFTVVAPNNASYTNLSNFTVGNNGNGTLTLNYPADFSASANTSLIGQYSVLFNSTLGTGGFYVELTNSSVYHRNQVVGIKALYAPEENVTVSLTGPNLNYSENLTADSTGVVRYANSTILSDAPANASSTYMVNVTSISGKTIKSPRDVQNFTVPGFEVNITARNLAGEPVPDVGVEVFENQTLISSMDTGSGGLMTTLLEAGNFFSNVTYGGQEIGVLSPMIVNETSTAFDIYCNLTDLKITVTDEDNKWIPGVGLYLYEENQTQAAMTINATDVNGTAIGHSILPILNNATIDYALNASLDGIVFNTTHLELPVAAWFNISIVVPKMNLQVNVTNASLRPIQNATVNAINDDGGLFYNGTTAANGTVTLRCTLGKYLVQVYKDGIELNETTVNVNVTTVNALITCPLYGLSVSVRVSDFFGRPIPKLTVILQRTGYNESMISDSNGLAPFSNVVGGDLEVAVYSGGQSNQLAVESLYVGNSTTIGITLGNYVELAGMLVGAGQFVTFVILVLCVVFILCLEVYRRIRHRPKKTES